MLETNSFWNEFADDDSHYCQRCDNGADSNSFGKPQWQCEEFIDIRDYLLCSFGSSDSSSDSSDNRYADLNDG